jgi:hypothetical protein
MRPARHRERQIQKEQVMITQFFAGREAELERLAALSEEGFKYGLIMHLFFS